MKITQRQGNLLLMGLLSITTLLVVLIQIVTGIQADSLLLSVPAFFLLSGLLVAYWLGWDYARHSTVILTTLFVAFGIPEPFVSEQASFAVFLAPVLALVLLGPWWGIGSALIIFIALFTRANWQGAYADPIGIVLYLAAVGGMILSRLVSDTTRQRAEADAQRAEAALARAEQRVRELAQRTEELKEREVQFRTLAETVSAAVWIVRGTSIRYANVACETITGYTRAELQKMQFWDFVHPDFQSLARQRGLARLRGEAVTTRYELKIMTRNGAERWLDVAASLMEFEGDPAILVTAFDITEHKQGKEALQRARDELERRVVERTTELQRVNAQLRYVLTQRHRTEEALRASEQRYRLLVETMNEGMGVADACDEFTYVNDKLCAMLGYERSELLGHRTADFIDASYLDTLQEHLERRQRGERSSYELALIRKDGQKMYAILSCAPIYDGGGTYRGSSGVLTDITERKRVEEQITAALHEKEILLKEIHHRVKNNLQVISSLLELQSSYIREPRMRAMFKDSQSRITSMALIHERLYQSGNLARIDVAEYVQDLLGHLLRSFGNRDSIVQLKLAVDPFFLDIDTAIPCGLILHELVSNALKYAFPAGRQGEICVSLSAGDDTRVRLQVKDTGIGISQDIDFHKTNSLGLRLVNMLTQQLRGTLTLDQRGGTTVTITIPYRAIK